VPNELFNVDATISVIDLSGKQVILEHIQKTKSGLHTLNVSELPNGIYFITLNSANKNYNSKLIINK
jgi:ABC-type enterochelin transport system permease subunit